MEWYESAGQFEYEHIQTLAKRYNYGFLFLLIIRYNCNRESLITFERRIKR